MSILQYSVVVRTSVFPQQGYILIFFEFSPLFFFGLLPFLRGSEAVARVQRNTLKYQSINKNGVAFWTNYCKFLEDLVSSAQHHNQMQEEYYNRNAADSRCNGRLPRDNSFSFWPCDRFFSILAATLSICGPRPLP